ncbi:MAG: glycosyltransferase [Ferruginibacter sp.]|nr:glycosyltransferase [Ferruginibacter sp.]
MEQQRKNIVIIGPAFPLRGGGMASFNERLARAFQDEGHRVSIFTFSLQYPSFLFPGTSQYSTEEAPEGLDIKVLINSVNPFNWIKVGWRLKKLRPDIIVVRYWLPFMGPCFGTILRIAKTNGHSKIVCIADNIIPHEKRFGDKPFTQYFIKPVDAFITMSQQVLKDLRTFTSTKAALYIPHPLYDHFGAKKSKPGARQTLHIEQDDFVLLFFGFIRKYKGLDLLFDAIAILKSDKIPIQGLKLLVAGEFYEDRSFYEAKINELGIADLLDLHTSFIADRDIANFFCAADVVVQPYRHATQSGVTPLAYHFDVPMIVTNVGGLPDMVPDQIAGLIAEPTAQSLAEKIREFHNTGAAHFLPGLQQEKLKYSWHNMVNGILEISR